MFEPLLSAPFAVQVHVATVLPAAVLGALLLAGRKGTARHRLAGKIWLLLMLASAVSSFFVHELRMIGSFSVIHLLSAYVIFGCFLAYRHARAGRIAAHRRQMIGLYLGGIVGAGLFTLLPGRIMGRIFLTSAGGAALLATAVCLVALGALAVSRHARRSGGTAGQG